MKVFMVRKRCVLILLVLGICGLTFTLYSNYVLKVTLLQAPNSEGAAPSDPAKSPPVAQSAAQGEKVLGALDEPIEVNSTYIIGKDVLRVLFWTPWFFERWWFLPDTSMLTCGDVTCQYTHDKSLYNVSHGVAFHLFHRSFDPNEVQNTDCMPKYRDPKQHWIVHNIDPPSMSIRTDITQLNNLFNLSATYHTQSDMVMPYGYCDKVQNAEVVKDTYTTGKTGLVAWIVSHCNTHSGRENYIAELKKYINVTIHGKCDHFGSKGTLCTEKLFMDKRDCQEALDFINSHKFYIAFENSVCLDYITEKVFKILETGMETVPILYGGGPNIKALLPPNSYVDAALFDSPKELAQFLTKLDQNDSLYNQFFAWRSDFKCRLSSLPCDFCQHFHRLHGRKNALVKDIPAIFGQEKNCATSVDTYQPPKKTLYIGCRTALN